MAQPIITITRVALDATVGTFARLVTIDIPDGNATPEEFAAVVSALPDLSGPDVVLITGRAPIWGYGMLIHRAHATPAVGCFDPRLGGFVVVEEHALPYVVGGIIILLLPI